MVEDKTRISNWDASYARKENYVFSPADEVVRFVSRHLRRRVGVEIYEDVLPGSKNAKVLDLGCGVGRHVRFGLSMGLDMYGIELSSQAVEIAHMWLNSESDEDFENRINVGDARRLPWGNGFFDHVISDSVLDSMEFTIATDVISEVHRVLKKEGLFYCSLIALRTRDAELLVDEIVVDTKHEEGTIQSFFDMGKIHQLFGANFDVLSAELHSIENQSNTECPGRWHLVLRRK